MRSGAGWPESYPGGTWTITGRSPPTTTSAPRDATGEAEGATAAEDSADGTEAADEATGPADAPGGEDEPLLPHAASRKPMATTVSLRGRAIAKPSRVPTVCGGTVSGTS